MKKVVCPHCTHNFKAKGEKWFSQTKCPKCYRVFPIIEHDKSFFLKRYKDVTALVIDKKTGQPLWLDKKGNKLRHDSPEVRYDAFKDPRGWKATGKKVHKDYGYGKW